MQDRDGKDSHVKNEWLWMRRPCLFSFQAVISSLTYWSFHKNLNFPVKITIGMFTWRLFTQNQLVTWFDVNVAWQPHRPGGSVPYGRMSVPVQLHRSREAAGSPSHSVAATWLHLGTQQFHIWYKIFFPKCKDNGSSWESVESTSKQKFTSREEGIKDDLRSVVEISELSLPDGK